MIKNLKHLIVFILTFLLVVMIPLAASTPVSQIGLKDISASSDPSTKAAAGKWSGLWRMVCSTDNTAKFDRQLDALTVNGITKMSLQNRAWNDQAVVKSIKAAAGKWSGLGMLVSSTDDTAKFDSYIDTLLASGITEIRLENQTWNAPAAVARVKADAIRAIAKGANVIWGVGQWNGISSGYPEFPPTSASNWADYRQAILDAALWAQNNGVYEFQIGNEEEKQNDDTTLTDAQLRNNLKSLATEVQAIFTRGNVSYSCAMDSIDSWISIGKGDIDLLASNFYTGGTDDFDNYWTTKVAALVNAFGPNGTYISEFAPSYVSLDSYSTDETLQAAAVTEMIDYIKASGIKRAIYFSWNYSGYGVLKDDGTPRLLWN